MRTGRFTVNAAFGVLGRIVVRRPWWVIGTWLLLAAILASTIPPLIQLASDRDQEMLPADAAFHAEAQPDLLGGVVVLGGAAQLRQLDPAWADQLYSASAPTPREVAPTAASFTAIPYYAWANRKAGGMQVWLRVEQW